MVKRRQIRGFSIIEAMVVLAILGALLAAGLSTLDYLTKERTRQQVLASLLEVRERIFQLLEDPLPWQKTILNNPGLSCLPPVTSGPCTHGATVSPVLHDAAGTVKYDPATQGFDRNGLFCLQADGLATCPFRYEIVTTLTCDGTPTCDYPAVVTVAKLVVPFGVINFPLNVDRYTIEVFHSLGDRQNPSYSQKCVDWAARGWATEIQCLTDGRWHAVLSHSNVGTVSYGTLAGLQAHVNAGADIRVIVEGAGLVETCAQVYRGGGGAGPMYCLTSNRFSGEVAAMIGLGAVRFGSDGSVTCVSNSNPNGVNTCGGITSPMTWMIRY